MKVDQAVESVRPDFRLKILYFRLARILPELAVQVFAAARVGCVVLKPGRIANRVKKEGIAPGEFQILFQHRDKARECQRAFRFVAVNGREDANANGVAAALRAEVDVARQAVAPTGALEVAERFAEKPARILGDKV